jgi:hypothetical protein
VEVFSTSGTNECETGENLLDMIAAASQPSAQFLDAIAPLASSNPHLMNPAPFLPPPPSLLLPPRDGPPSWLSGSDGISQEYGRLEGPITGYGGDSPPPFTLEYTRPNEGTSLTLFLSICTSLHFVYQMDRTKVMVHTKVVGRMKEMGHMEGMHYLGVFLVA